MEFLKSVQKLNPDLIYLQRVHSVIIQEGLKRLAESIHDETIFECSLQLWKLVPAFIFYLYQYLFL